MALLKIQLNAISVVNLVMSIGIAVEFCVCIYHIHFRFFVLLPTYADDRPCSANATKKRLFGRTVPIHTYLGGGAAADTMLWRNKQLSGGILAAVTILWFLFQGVGYHFITFVCHFLMLSLVLLLLGTYVAPFLNKKPPTLPEVLLPEDLFLSIAHLLRHKLNELYATLRCVASGKDFKKMLKVIASLWIISKIGGWFAFLTLIYIVLLMAATLPVIYEKYEDEVDSAANKALIEINKQYAVLDEKVLSKIPSCPFSQKKHN